VQVVAAFFVGREAELARLRTLVAEAREGRSGTLALSGPPGQGKTALLDRLCDESSDARLLRATGVEMEAELPFGTLDACSDRCSAISAPWRSSAPV
jgi:chromosomal replication initiation ATPase DnaA